MCLSFFLISLSMRWNNEAFRMLRTPSTYFSLHLAFTPRTNTDLKEFTTMFNIMDGPQTRYGLMGFWMITIH